MSSPAYLRKTVLDDMQAEVAEVNEANGWYEEERTVGEDIALLHSEVSEMLEAYRDTGLDDTTGEWCQPGDHLAASVGEIDHTCKPEGFGSECADVLIRLLDTCDRRGVDLVAEFERKVAFNRTRGYKHGGKRL